MNAYVNNPGGAAPGSPGALLSFYSPGSYAINNVYWDRSDGVYPPTSQGDNKKDPVRLLSDLQHPSTTIHYSEFASYLPQLAAGQAYAPEIAWPNQSGTGSGPNANQAVASLYSFTPPVLYDLPFRHTGGANVVYCDAHVKFARPGDLLHKNSKGLYSAWIVEDTP
jgi:prepilin-type processing-associated H-X9-DG protein